MMDAAGNSTAPRVGYGHTSTSRALLQQPTMHKPCPWLLNLLLRTTACVPIRLLHYAPCTGPAGPARACVQVRCTRCVHAKQRAMHARRCKHRCCTQFAARHPGVGGCCSHDAGVCRGVTVQSPARPLPRGHGHACQDTHRLACAEHMQALPHIWGSSASLHASNSLGQLHTCRQPVMHVAGAPTDNSQQCCHPWRCCLTAWAVRAWLPAPPRAHSPAHSSSRAGAAWCLRPSTCCRTAAPAGCRRGDVSKELGPHLRAHKCMAPCVCPVIPDRHHIKQTYATPLLLPSC
jgi:hypothetical protein